MSNRNKPADDPIIFVRCIECGNEQADMGRNVCCEECGGTTLEPIEEPKP